MKLDNLTLRFISGPDIDRLEITRQEILSAVEEGCTDRGRGQVVLEPRVHLVFPNGGRGHFNVLRGHLSPQNVSGVKVVGDLVENYRLGLPSELALTTLYDLETGSRPASGTAP